MATQTRDRILLGAGLFIAGVVLAWIFLPSMFNGWTQGCTAIGCWNSLDVVMEDAAVAAGDYEAEVCLEGVCQTVAVTVTVNDTGSARFRAEGLSGSPPDSRDVQVTVRLLGDGVMMAERSGPVRFRSDRPNGPRCDPVCFSGSLVV